MNDVLHGTVVVAIGGREFTLKPTLEAALKIERRFGGLRPAYDSVRLLSIDALAHVIAAGARLKEDEAEALPEKIFSEGVGGVTAQVMPFLGALLSPTPKSVAEQGNVEAASTAQ